MPLLPNQRPTELNFGDTPTAPPGYRLAIVQGNAAVADPDNIGAYYRDTSIAFPNVGSINTQAGSSYNVVIDDWGLVVELTNFGPTALGLPDPSTVPLNFWLAVVCTFDTTITPNAGGINGAASFVLSAGQSCFIFSNGYRYLCFAGSSGGAGGPGTPGSTWYSGSGVPSVGTGIDGDYYLNTANGDVYTKALGSWGSPIENLTGPTGPAGPAPSGTGFVRVAAGVLENPATIILDTDGALAADSDGRIASQKAVKTYVDGHGGIVGVNVQSGASYNPVDGDKGKLISYSNAGAKTASLSGLTDLWFAYFENTGAGTLTITPASGTIDSASSLQVFANQGCLIMLSSGNYYTSRGIVDRTTFVIAGVPGKPAAAQNVCLYVAAGPIIFAANFAGSFGKIASNGANPTTNPVTYGIYKNGSSAGSAQVSSSGVYTFATIGGTSLTLNAGDILTVVAPGVQDATLSDATMTLVGTLGTVLSAGQPIPVFNVRTDNGGIYNPAATYQPYDVVGYGTPISSYVCILTTTGNLPTNTTYWQILAAAGSTTGDALKSAIQVQSYTAIDDAGTTNAYTTVLTPAISSYVEYLIVQFLAANTNTGASTLAVNGLAVKSIKKWSGGAKVALVAGDITAGQIIVVIYDGTDFVTFGGGGTTYPTGGNPGQALFKNTTTSGDVGWKSSVVLLDTKTASSSASLDFTGKITSDYNEYIIELMNIVPATDGTSIRLRCSVGGVFDSTSGHYSFSNWFIVNGASVATGSDSDSSIGLGSSVSSTASNGGLSGTYRFRRPGSTSMNKVLDGLGINTSTTNSGKVCTQTIGGIFNQTTSAVDGLRILALAGNLASGDVLLYGVGK